MSLLDRGRAAAMGRETLRVLRERAYRNTRGGVVAIGSAIDRAVTGTRDYPPHLSLPTAAPGNHATRVEVCNESTLAAARRLMADGHGVVALNFASAKSPGGGFLSGARAQEESIARASGLHACLVDRPMYAHHRALHDPLYTRWAIYSPSVPVFRDDEGAFLDEAWECAFITAPAPNAKAMGDSTERADEIRQAFDDRIRRVLGIAVAHGHDTVVLGAWGCGAFGNDPAQVAAQFQDALSGDFAGAFRRVVFAILDWSEERRFIGPFQASFSVEVSS
jgi:uncharacterized protein (TIGR02452 family)